MFLEFGARIKSVYEAWKKTYDSQIETRMQIDSQIRCWIVVEDCWLVRDLKNELNRTDDWFLLGFWGKNDEVSLNALNMHLN